MEIEKITTQYNDMVSRTSEPVWESIAPIADLFVMAILVIGIFLILISLIYMAVNILQMLAGKKELNGKTVKRFVFILILGILMSSTGWIRVIHFIEGIMKAM